MTGAVTTAPTAIRDAAEGYADRGWVPLALHHDDKGKPKQPIVKGWQHTTLDTWKAQPWRDALGVGNLLGPASGRLAVIDVATSRWPMRPSPSSCASTRTCDS